MAIPAIDGLIPRDSDYRTSRLLDARNSINNELSSPSLIAMSVGVQAVGFVGSLFGSQKPKSIFEQFSPFTHSLTPLSRADITANATFAVEERSDQQNIFRMNRAAELFIRQRKCPPLNIRDFQFSEEIREVQDADNLIDAMCASLRLFHTYYKGVPVDICLFIDDVKTVIGELLRRVLSSRNLRSSINDSMHHTVVSQKGAVGWVKYEFDSRKSVVEACCVKQTRLDISCKMYSFAYPSFRDFLDEYEYALRNAE